MRVDRVLSTWIKASDWPGHKAGAVVVFGLTVDRDGPTGFPVFSASR